MHERSALCEAHSSCFDLIIGQHDVVTEDVIAAVSEDEEFTDSSDDMIDSEKQVFNV